MRIKEQRELALLRERHETFKGIKCNVRDILRHYAWGGRETTVGLDYRERQHVRELERAVNYLLPPNVRLVYKLLKEGIYIYFVELSDGN